MFAWLVVHANDWTVRTTRVPLAWAALMTLVKLELVQPLQPASLVESAPVEVAPIPKYAMVDSSS